MLRFSHVVTAVMVMLSICAIITPARADSITLSGTTIPLNNCTILAIRSGEIHYRDPAGQRQRRNLDDVQHIGFDDLDALDAAEAAWHDGELDLALKNMLQALLAAEGDLQRKWIHSRLAILHDLRHEYAPAAGHIATVLQYEPHTYWRKLEPLTEPGTRTQPGDPDVETQRAAEAMHRIDQAKQSIADRRLLRMLESMQENIVRDIESLNISIENVAADPGETISGFTADAIKAGIVASTTPTDLNQNGKPQMPDEPDDPSAESETDAAEPPAATAPESALDTDDPLSPNAIEQLLEQRSFDSAAKRCEAALAQSNNDNNRAQLYYQLGRALAGLDRPHEAGLNLARSVIHFPQSEWAPASLIELAVVYRRDFADEPTARRLLQRAVSLAETLGQSQRAREARSLLSLIE